MTQMAAKVVFLDRMLANYGPETAQTRELFRRSVERVVESHVAGQSLPRSPIGPQRVAGGGDVRRDPEAGAAERNAEPPSNLRPCPQRWNSARLRWLEFEQADTSISTPMLSILTLWLAILFVSFGLFSPSNSTVVVALMLAALSVSGAVFLILELCSPFDGLMQISDAPFVNAISHLGR